MCRCANYPQPSKVLKNENFSSRFWGLKVGSLLRRIMIASSQHQALQHNWDLVDTDEVWQVVDVLMDVDGAVLHLHHFVVSLLCTLPNIEEEASCLVGVVEVDVHNHDGEVGEHKCLRTEPQPGDE